MRSFSALICCLSLYFHPVLAIKCRSANEANPENLAGGVAVIECSTMCQEAYNFASKQAHDDVSFNHIPWSKDKFKSYDAGCMKDQHDCNEYNYEKVISSTEPPRRVYCCDNADECNQAAMNNLLAGLEIKQYTRNTTIATTTVPTTATTTVKTAPNKNDNNTKEDQRANSFVALIVAFYLLL